MRILHYSLGVPPYRKGGLTKYSFDLMKSEMEEGNDVFLLYPGHYNPFLSSRIVKNKAKESIHIYELINPLPVPLLGGIGKPEKFCKGVSDSFYMSFLKEVRVSVIHLHTLMGIHREFIEAARKLNIKIVYTTHDHFGFCPKVNMIDYEGKVCQDSGDGLKCAYCNVNGYDIKLIYFMQSKLYRNFKDSFLIKKIRCLKRDAVKESRNQISHINKVRTSHKGKEYEYAKLRMYYIDVFGNVDFFHYNSLIAKCDYEKFMACKGRLISITHGDILDRRELKCFRNSDSILNIAYMGPVDLYKGFHLLKSSLDILISKNVLNWHLDVYGDDSNYAHQYDGDYITIKGKYDYNHLKDIFKNVDLLIVPGICRETFGFVVLEALSYGVPAMITENVGAKDLIIDGDTGIIVNSSALEISAAIERVIKDRDILKKLNRNIVNMDFPYTMKQHTNEILDLYRDVLKGSG